MFTSPRPVVFMTCGHSIHKRCYDQHMSVSYKCPICNKSLANMETQFRNLDVAIQGQPMPAEFRDTQALVLCNDCSGRSTVPYHWLGLKCRICLSYNTVELQILGPNSQHNNNNDEGTPPPQPQTPLYALSHHLNNDLGPGGAGGPGPTLSAEAVLILQQQQQQHQFMTGGEADRIVDASHDATLGGTGGLVGTGTGITGTRRRHSSHVAMTRRPSDLVATSYPSATVRLGPHLDESSDSESEDGIFGLWRGSFGNDEDDSDYVDDSDDMSEDSEEGEEEEEDEDEDEDEEDDDILLIGHR